MELSAPVCLLLSLEESVATRVACNAFSPSVEGCSPVLQRFTTGLCG